MTAGHIRYKVKTHFLGTRDGELFAVCSWAGDGTCTMIGEARLKLNCGNGLRTGWIPGRTV